MRRLVGIAGKRCGALPVSALERVARRNDGERCVGAQVSEILFEQETIPAGFIDLVDEGLGLGVLRELQVRVNHEVRCVIIVRSGLEAPSGSTAIDSSQSPTIE